MSTVLLQYAEKVWSQTDPQYRSRVFAFVLAPALACAVVAFSRPETLPNEVLAPPLSVVPLGVTVDGKVTTSKSVVIVVQPDSPPVGVPFKAVPLAVESSLKPSDWEPQTVVVSPARNAVRIEPRGSELQPLVVLAHGDVDEAKLEIGGKHLAIDDARLPARQGTDVLLGVLCSAAFAIGLGLASSFPSELASEDGCRS